MPDYSKKIVYLTQAQYQELITNQSITVNGVTVNYNQNDIYVTPQAEPYIKPVSGIPASDLASGVIPTVPVTDVQVNGTSVVTNGVANIPLATTANYGAVKIDSTKGIYIIGGDGVLRINPSAVSTCKSGTEPYRPIVPACQHSSVFYGLAKAAGDTTQSASSNAVGTYTNEAKAAIQSMLGIQSSVYLTETVSGTTPSITAVPNIKYICGEVSTLSVTPPANGTCDIIFESGSTATTLTVPNTVKWPSWFDATSLETDTIYEIMITDATYGSVMTWATT